MTNSNKPPKPYKDFPLTLHPVGYWCKSILEGRDERLLLDRGFADRSSSSTQPPSGVRWLGGRSVHHLHGAGTAGSGPPCRKQQFLPACLAA
jgi:hypothetical protein